MNYRVEYDKIDEVADRLRDFEKSGKPRYFNISYVNGSHSKAQPVGSDRQSGAKKFKQQVWDIVNYKNADKIIVQEFNQRSHNVKNPAHEVEILIERSYPAIPETNLISNSQEEKDELQKPGSTSKGYNPEEVLGKLESMKQDIRSEVAKEFQLIKEQEERERIIGENEKLKTENAELKESNNKLLDNNEELFEEVQKLQKYVPENFKIGHLSMTRTLGSILGTAAETLAKNILTKKPEKVRSLLGDVAYEQLAGFIEDETDELGQAEEPEELELLEPLEPVSPEEEQKQKIAGAIHELNLRISNEEISKIQCMYAYILNEDETINPEKLNILLRFIAGQHKKEQAQKAQETTEEVSLE